MSLLRCRGANWCPALRLLVCAWRGAGHRPSGRAAEGRAAAHAVPIAGAAEAARQQHTRPHKSDRTENSRESTKIFPVVPAFSSDQLATPSNLTHEQMRCLIRMI